MKRSLKALARSFSTHSGPPVRVAFTPDAGRGVFATRNINEGEVIHTAEPVLAHPSLQNLSKACFFCLRHLAHRFPSKDGASHVNSAHNDVLETSTCHNGLQPKFCSQSCSDSAKTFYTLEKKADWKIFNKFCKHGIEGCTRYPIPCETMPRHCFMCKWMHTRTMLLDALKGSGVPEDQLAFVSNDWYCGVLARISVNSFRVEVLVEDSSDLLAAAAASVSGDAVSGSAVYILPSMYNHDCDPNVDISWPTNATARLSARRDMEQGEELRITYIDASMPQPSRQKLLKQAYHFECNCSRCKDKD